MKKILKLIFSIVFRVDFWKLLKTHQMHSVFSDILAKFS